ncbi:hypothetical protein ACIBI4_24115 [Streptomyces sp. NPDC050418]|uniref:hypothetical protein n=1 Tax=Streptomyces sp. NPDC050418 TaxID=3365612 RepID=UPI0037B85947
MDLSDEGEPLDAQWHNLDNNVSGILHAHNNAAPIAERFVRAGWRSRSCSWHGYEVGTRWCELELEPSENDILLNGVIDPLHFDELVALLGRFGLVCTVELYDGDGHVMREVRVGWDGPCPATPKGQSAHRP